MPMVPGHQSPSGQRGGRCVPPPRLSPHMGRAAAACSRSWVLGGQRGQGACCGHTLLLAASRPGGRKRGFRSSQSPLARLVHLSMGDAV